jgi:hypothetical protein
MDTFIISENDIQIAKIWYECSGWKRARCNHNFQKCLCVFPPLSGTTRRINSYMLGSQVKLKYVQYILCRKSLSISTVWLVRFHSVITCYSNQCADSTTRVCISNNLYCVYFVCVLMAARSSSTDCCQTREQNNVLYTNWPTDQSNTLQSNKSI